MCSTTFVKQSFTLSFLALQITGLKESEQNKTAQITGIQAKINLYEYQVKQNNLNTHFVRKNI